MKKRLILITVIILALILTGCNKEPNKATASYEYDGFTISLEQIVNSDDELQIDVTLTLPEGTTWGDLVEDPNPDDTTTYVMGITYGYILFQQHMSEDDLLDKPHIEIVNDTAYMAQHNGVDYYPSSRTTGVYFDTNTVQSTFFVPIEKIDVSKPNMSFVLPLYELRYSVVKEEDIVLKTFEGPFILNWEAVYE